jgi:hypothetical protein
MENRAARHDDDDDDKEMCLTCGAILKSRVDRSMILGIPIPTKREYCEVCCYLQNERLSSLCQCPYKEPMPRLRRDGSVPQSVFDKIKQLQRDLAGIKPLF